MRERFLILFGLVGGWVAAALGGCDGVLRALLFFMAVDIVTGLVLAGVLGKSYKSECGGICSGIIRKGIVKKCMMLLMVAVGVQVDYVLGWDFVRYCVIIAFIGNELVSITENMGSMGVPIHPAIKQAIDILKKKEGGGE